MMNVTTAEHTGLWGFSVKGIGILCPRPRIYDVGNRGPLVVDMVILWFYKDGGEKMETTLLSCGYVRILEKNMETTVLHWVYFGIMEKKWNFTVRAIGFV